jgi:hypothetical protein
LLWGEGEDEAVIIRSACKHTTDATQRAVWFCNHTPVFWSERVLERAPESGPWDEKLREEEQTGGRRGRGQQCWGGDNDNNEGMHNNYINK